jgi:hypothetical protein
MGSEMVMGAYEMQRIASTFADIFRAVPQDGNKFLYYIIQVTGDVT